MQRVCVFCGSRMGDDPVHAAQARSLGATLVQRKLGLVYGGGNIGLMGVIADAALQAGGEVIGVITEPLVVKELAHTGLTQLHVTATMHQRKALMADLSDAFIPLPGGFGTADEMFEVLTWAQLGLHTKPVGLLNTLGYFDALLQWLDRAVADGFLRPGDRQLLLEAGEFGRLLDLLAQYRPAEKHRRWLEQGER